jgi:hypothetical protein
MKNQEDDRGGCVLIILIIIYVILVILSGCLSGCSTCRLTAIQDAKDYQKRGYEARIVVYRVGLDGLLYGGFVWQYHAEAQYFCPEHKRWEWAGATGLPAFYVGEERYTWKVADYEALLKKHGKYY